MASRATSIAKAYLGLRGTDRPARRESALHRGRRRHDPESPRQPQRRRRGHADLAHGADRKGHPARLSAGPSQRAADEDGADRQRPARELRAQPDAAHDQHLHAGRRLDPGRNYPLGRNGLYAVNFGGGQVDITNGKFVFSASEAYLIEDGKVTRPVKGATLIGNGPDVLTRVTRWSGTTSRSTQASVLAARTANRCRWAWACRRSEIDGITVGGTRA